MTEAPGETQTPGTPEAAASPARVLASEYNSNRAFADFPISPEVLKGLTELGYAMATPIQAASIEPALAGKDLVLRAKTGTGKTAAFGIPIVEKVLAGDRRTRAVVLAPTRELALQIAQEVAGIARFKD
ncbi:MAG TPA: DEAD/DEAH box helicase, partial [Myxococcota bacterium]|nr:DEAD/DEAH box helicase [Myxococcota bacterium]